MSRPPITTPSLSLREGAEDREAEKAWPRTSSMLSTAAPSQYPSLGTVSTEFAETVGSPCEAPIELKETCVAISSEEGPPVVPSFNRLACSSASSAEALHSTVRHSSRRRGLVLRPHPSPRLIPTRGSQAVCRAECSSNSALAATIKSNIESLATVGRVMSPLGLLTAVSTGTVSAVLVLTLGGVAQSSAEAGVAVVEGAGPPMGNCLVRSS